MPSKQGRAYAAVSRAISEGSLPPLSTVTCAGCGGSAQVYHHPRGYEGEAALDVEALCHSCHKSASHPADDDLEIRIYLRITKGQYKILKQMAETDCRSVPNQVLHLLDYGVEWWFRLDERRWAEQQLTKRRRAERNG